MVKQIDAKLKMRTDEKRKKKEEKKRQKRKKKAEHEATWKNPSLKPAARLGA